MANDNPPPTHIAVPTSLYKAIGTYLGSQPYREVAEFIADLQACQGLVMRPAPTDGEPADQPADAEAPKIDPERTKDVLPAAE